MHVRHCFKLSSYWNGKEARKAGAEEQGTPGGKREREQSGHRQTKILLLFLMTEETQRRGGLICSGVSEHMAALLLLLLAYLARAILHLENISPKVNAGLHLLWQNTQAGGQRRTKKGR